MTQAYKRGRYDSPCVTCLRLTPTNNFPCFPIKQYAPAQTTSTQAVALPYQTTLGRVRGGACGCHGNLQFLSISSSLHFFFLFSPNIIRFFHTAFAFQHPTANFNRLSIQSPNTPQHAFHRFTARLCGPSQWYVVDPFEPDTYELC